MGTTSTPTPPTGEAYRRGFTLGSRLRRGSVSRRDAVRDRDGSLTSYGRQSPEGLAFVAGFKAAQAGTW